MNPPQTRSVPTESLDVPTVDRTRWGGGFGRWMVNLPVMRRRVPLRYRPVLYYDSLYNFGAGAFFALYALAIVVITSILDGGAFQLALLGAMFGGSSLFSPLVSYIGQKVRMRTLMVYPNLIVAALLCGTALPFAGATTFTIIVGLAFWMRVFPRVAEMNMYRVLYPTTHRAAAVGWLKSMFSLSGLVVTLVGYVWFLLFPDWYWMLYCAVAGVLVAGSLCYARIPLSRVDLFLRPQAAPPHRAFWRGVKIFLADRRFLLFQFGFSLAGAANHMAYVFVAAVLKDDVLRPRGIENLVPQPVYQFLEAHWNVGRGTLDGFVLVMIVGLIVAVAPAVLVILSSPVWGRFLDRITPMHARAIFNTVQCAAYAFYAYGGVSRQVWPFMAGAAIHAIANGGGTINWLTGSLYFAPTEHVSLYNAIHVGLTGLRGMIAPLVGGYLLSPAGMDLGAGLFWISAGLSLLGAAVMLAQALSDKGLELS